MKKNLKKCVYIYIYIHTHAYILSESLCVHLKLTYYKSTILQLKEFTLLITVLKFPIKTDQFLKSSKFHNFQQQSLAPGISKAFVSHPPGSLCLINPRPQQTFSLENFFLCTIISFPSISSFIIPSWFGVNKRVFLTTHLSRKRGGVYNICSVHFYLGGNLFMLLLKDIPAYTLYRYMYTSLSSRTGI